MKRKDIILLVVSFLAIGASVFFMYKMLNPGTAANTPNQVATENKAPEFTGQIDDETLEQLKERNDYGEATLENIGKSNPFGQLN